MVSTTELDLLVTLPLNAAHVSLVPQTLRAARYHKGMTNK
jgi:hypothetical protein